MKMNAFTKLMMLVLVAAMSSGCFGGHNSRGWGSSSGSNDDAPAVERVRRPRPNAQAPNGTIDVEHLFGFSATWVPAGGRVAANQLRSANGQACRGWVTRAPSARFNVDASSLDGLMFTATADFDTTLAIHAPNGRWYCADDDDGLNPVLNLVAQQGDYAVFVGAFDDDTIGQAVLTVAETY